MRCTLDYWQAHNNGWHIPAFVQGFWDDASIPGLAEGLAGSEPGTCISARRTFMSASSDPVSAPGMPAAILLIIVASYSIIPLRCRA